MTDVRYLPPSVPHSTGISPTVPVYNPNTGATAGASVSTSPGAGTRGLQQVHAARESLSAPPGTLPPSGRVNVIPAGGHPQAATVQLVDRRPSMGTIRAGTAGMAQAGAAFAAPKVELLGPKVPGPHPGSYPGPYAAGAVQVSPGGVPLTVEELMLVGFVAERFAKEAVRRDDTTSAQLADRVLMKINAALQSQAQVQAATQAAQVQPPVAWSHGGHSVQPTPAPYPEAAVQDQIYLAQIRAQPPGPGAGRGHPGLPDAPGRRPASGPARAASWRPGDRPGAASSPGAPRLGRPRDAGARASTAGCDPGRLGAATGGQLVAAGGRRLRAGSGGPGNSRRRAVDAPGLDGPGGRGRSGPGTSGDSRDLGGVVESVRPGDHGRLRTAWRSCSSWGSWGPPPSCPVRRASDPRISRARGVDLASWPSPGSAIRADCRASLLPRVVPGCSRPP